MYFRKKKNKGERDGCRVLGKGCNSKQTGLEMQMKTTMGYHLTPVRMAIIQKNTNTTIFKVDNNKDLLYSTGNSAQYSVIN